MGERRRRRRKAVFIGIRTHLRDAAEATGELVGMKKRRGGSAKTSSNVKGCDGQAGMGSNGVYSNMVTSVTC